MRIRNVIFSSLLMPILFGGIPTASASDLPDLAWSCPYIETQPALTHQEHRRSLPPVVLNNIVRQLKNADTNNDGRISRAEANQATVLSANFELIDADSDGYLTVNEVAQHIDRRLTSAIQAVSAQNQ